MAAKRRVKTLVKSLAIVILFAIANFSFEENQSENYEVFPEIERVKNVVFSEYEPIENSKFFGRSGDFSGESIIPRLEDFHPPAVKTEPVQDVIKPQYFDVPLSEDLQDEMFRLCEKYGVDPCFVLAVIYKESGFNPNAVSSTNDYGLMQINIINHGWLAEKLGLTDMFDPVQNMEAGIYIYSQFLQKYDIKTAIMCYSFGESGAKNMIKKGIKSTKYADSLAQFTELIRERNGL